MRAVANDVALEKTSPTNLDHLNTETTGFNAVTKQAHNDGHGFSLRDINPHNVKTNEGGLNCIKCATALDNTLAGYPAVAMPGLASNTFAGGRNILENTFGSKLLKMNSIDEITSAVSVGGHGARGIVIGYGSGSPYSHAFNVANQTGIVRYLDGQIGATVKDINQYDNFWYLPTKR